MALKNGNLRIYIGTAVTVLVVIGAWLVTWGQVIQKVDTLSAQVELNRSARDTTLQLEPRVANIEEDIKEIQETMKDGFKEIMRELKEMKNETR